MVPRGFFAATALLIALTACNGDRVTPSSPALPFRPTVAAPASPISHVIFIVQENRSFNNLFLGFPGAKTQHFGIDSSGNRVVLKPENLSTEWDIDHFSIAYFTACDGRGTLPGTDCKMDGWNKEATTPGAPLDAAYSYVPRNQIAPYWTMARQYVLADRMFASNLDGSFVSHQYAVAAYAAHTVDAPATIWGCEGGSLDRIHKFTNQRQQGAQVRACFDFPTIASEADSTGVTWRFYTGKVKGDGGLWSSYQADRPIYYGADWKRNVVNPPTQFLTDVKRGQLANITWITPTYDTSDHPGLLAADGPAWVASLVNAVGTSKFWKSSAIFIIWDDWGGLFDPVKPVFEDYDGLGFRVPLIAISPYAKSGYVTHAQYETSSVLRYIEDNFGLAQLAPSDARAADPGPDVFDYSAPPRTFKPIPGGKSIRFWQSRGRGASIGKDAHMLGDD